MKTRMVHRCSECGGESPRWLGRCPACDAWGTLVEQADAVAGSGVCRGLRRRWSGADRRRRRTRRRPRAHRRRRARPGARGRSRRRARSSLLAGEPGMGKSTLLLQALGRMAAGGTSCLLVTAEESCAQVRLRAERVGALDAGLLVVAETSLPHVLAHVDAVAPAGARARLDPDRRRSRPPRRAGFGHPGARLRLPAGAAREGAVARDRARRPRHQGGHVAGPRVLEHMVDTVLSVDGDRGHSLAHACTR